MSIDVHMQMHDTVVASPTEQVHTSKPIRNHALFRNRFTLCRAQDM